MAARQQQFLEVVGLDEAQARLRRHLDLDPVPASGSRWRRPGARAGRRCDRRGGRARASTAPASMASPCAPPTPSARPRTAPCRLRSTPRSSPRACAGASRSSPGTATRDRHRRHGAARRRRRGHGRAHRAVRRPEARAGVEMRRPVAPGAAIACAGTDIARGETVLRAGQLLTSREIGVLAAVGLAEVAGLPQPTRRRSSPPATRSSRPASRSARARSTTPTPPSSPRRSRSWAASRCRSASAPTTKRALRACARRGARAATWCCSPAAPPREPATSPIGRSRRLDDPGIVAHGVALKPGKPLVPRGDRRQARWSSCRAFRPRRSSPFTSSWRR